MQNFIVWVTHWFGGGRSDGYDLVMKARDLAAARRQAKAYAKVQARESGDRVTVRVESEAAYNRRVRR